MGLFRRTVPGNGRTVVATVYEPDAFSVQAASLGMITNTYSPASAGIHSPGGGTRGFVGDRGYGVNAWGGAGPLPMQHFGGLTVPVTLPEAQRLGFGAGVAGQPGLPSTGDLADSYGSLGMMGLPLGLGG